MGTKVKKNTALTKIAKSSAVENTKDFLRKIAYNVRYGRKFKEFNIDKSFSDVLINRIQYQDKDVEDVFQLIRKSKTKEDFENNIKDYFESTERNSYATTLLIGNLFGKYAYTKPYYDSVKNLNIDAFSRENEELLQIIKSHFAEFIMNDNRRKNAFAERIKIDENIYPDFSQDINEAEITEDFERVLNADEKVSNCDVGYEGISNGKLCNTTLKYIIKTIGTYSKEDIQDNFDFILYDMNNSSQDSLDDRRKKYFLHKSLSNDQLKKIDQISILRQRLQSIKGKESEQLLSRLNQIGNSLDENISELEDIYSGYEVLFRQDLIDNLYTPEEDVTIIENYKDLRPQLIHQFLRTTDISKDSEYEAAKEKIISERPNGNDSQELTDDEQKRLNELTNLADANLDQYKVNYAMERNMRYSDSMGLEVYVSNTSNQISAAVFEGKEFLQSSSVGIQGIGFNGETLSPEAIAISSSDYKTTNRGLYNIQYDEEEEFQEMSAPLSELIKRKGNSEVVMFRRGMDFDTKASYIFAIIDSSNPEQTAEIMEEIEETRKKEGLKAVVYDRCKIRESLEQSKQNEQEDYER